MGTLRKINAILLNIKINRPKLVDMCRYKLATYWQNFMEIYITGVKILQKVFRGLLFLTHTVYVGLFCISCRCLELEHVQLDELFSVVFLLHSGCTSLMYGLFMERIPRRSSRASSDRPTISQRRI